jgi:anti-sigma factor RsiW
MAVNEKDLETLEVWLDGELPAEQVDALRARISSEPEMAQAMDRLRADRQLRSLVWQTTEPAEAEVESLVAGVRAGIDRDEIWTLRFRALRNVSAIAASIVLVFAIGWISRDRLRIGPAQVPSPELAVNSVAAPKSPPAPPTVPDPRQSRPVDLASSGARTPSVRPPAYRVTVQDLSSGISLYRDLRDLTELKEVPDQFMKAMLGYQSSPQTPPGQGN